MKWYGTLALVFFMFLLAGIVYAGANTDKIGFVIIPLVFATHDPDFNHPTPFGSDITMTLDQETYKIGETIKISGNMGIKASKSLVTITVFKPDGIAVTSTKMLAANDGGISYQFKAGSGNMDVSGNYSITIENQYRGMSQGFFFNATDNVMPLKIVGDDVPFFGIFVYINNLFSWITGN